MTSVQAAVGRLRAGRSSDKGRVAVECDGSRIAGVQAVGHPLPCVTTVLAPTETDRRGNCDTSAVPGDDLVDIGFGG